jgi:acyl-CoA synthetase
MTSLSAVVAAHARRDPDGVAFAGAGACTWHEYSTRADALATVLVERFPVRGTRVAVQLPDGGDNHVLYVAAERAGIVVVGIGPRAGAREVEHILDRTGAAALFTGLPDTGDRVGAASALDPARAFGPDELWFLNSTSGTTGLPKVVMHQQSRWFAFHELAVRTGGLTTDDVFMSVLPSPFGFGLWTAHFTPAILGAPCVLLDRFTPEATLDAIDAFGVTVLAAVSTQFVMLLESAALDDHDLTSLRVLYTGGERVPADRAAAFEDRTGARVLQFYGSNETGALSATSLADDRRVRLETAGRVIPELHVRLFDPATGADVTATGGPGIAACRGAVNCLGYWDDDAADAELFTPDGWMRTGDLCTIAPDGVLTVVGRTSDVVIRGGKNISAAQVEAEVSTHPAVALCAAVAMPDPVFGERVCVYLEVRPGCDAPDLDALRAHLDARGVGKELWPEHVVVVDALPRASGGKLAKAELRTRAAAL